MQNNTFPFSALLSRMKYIGRWGLMRSSRPENLAEHTTEAAILAHTLACIARDICGDTEVRPEMVAVAALYHDAGEIMTGDMPTPVKYKNEELKQAYKKLEHESTERLVDLLPEALHGTMRPVVTGSALTPREKAHLKAADRISALAKCLEEEASGNTEFASAKVQQIRLLEEMNLPAVQYFLLHMLPCYLQNLDELTLGF